MRMYLASVDFDCDGPRTAVHRVDVPANLRDDDAMRKAVELDQIKFSISDPSEWFTVDENECPNAFAAIKATFDGFPANRTESIRNYAGIDGNIFNYDRH